MAGKRPRSSKSKTRVAVPAVKKKRAGSTTHRDYEGKIQPALTGMLTDVQTILGGLDENDSNAAPTEGILKRIKALIQETTNGKPTPTDHDNRIEKILYAAARMGDQYNIYGDSPDTNAYKDKPTGTTPEERVGELFTTINSIIREVLALLDSQANPGPQPQRSEYGDNDVTDFIVAIAGNTKDVVALIRQDMPLHNRRILPSK